MGVFLFFSCRSRPDRWIGIVRCAAESKRGRDKILGRLGPPTLSLSSLRVWPYVVQFQVLRLLASSGDLSECVSARKTIRISSRPKRRTATTQRPSSLVIPDTIQSPANPPHARCATLQTSWHSELSGLMEVRTPGVRWVEDSVDD